VHRSKGEINDPFIKYKKKNRKILRKNNIKEKKIRIKNADERYTKKKDYLFKMYIHHRCLLKTTSDKKAIYI